MIDENELVKDETGICKTLAGDLDGFRVLVDRYYGMVYAIGYAHLKQHEASEDLVQEVFLRAYLHLDTLDPPSQFPAWVSRIARNLAINWQRDEARRRRLAEMIPFEDMQSRIKAMDAPSHTEQLEEEERNRLLNEALFQLPPEQREMVLLRYMGNLNDRQIAERLAVHPSTVGRQLGKAMKSLLVPLEQSLRDYGYAVRTAPSGTAKTVALVCAAAGLDAVTRGTLVSASSGCAWPVVAKEMAAESVVSLGLLGRAAQLAAGAKSVAIGTVWFLPLSIVILTAAILSFTGGYASKKENAASSASVAPGAKVTISEADIQKAEEVFRGFQQAYLRNDSERAPRLWDLNLAAAFRGADSPTVIGWLKEIFARRPPELNAFLASSSLAEDVRLLTTHFANQAHLVLVRGTGRFEAKFVFTCANGVWKMVHMDVYPMSGDWPASPEDAREVMDVFGRYWEASRARHASRSVAYFNTREQAASWKIPLSSFESALERNLSMGNYREGFRQMPKDALQAITRSSRQPGVLVAKGKWGEWHFQKTKDGWKIIREELSLKR